MPRIGDENWETYQSTTLNSKLLPQGSGGIISGSSALVHGSGNVSAPPSNIVSVTETAPQSTSPFKTVSAVSSEKPQAPAAKLNPDDLRRKTAFLLEEYFSVRILDEALQCVEELKSPSYYPEVVKEAIFLALDRSPPCVEPAANLLEYLFIKKIGCLLFASQLDEIGIDLPKAPSNFGEIIGLKKVEDDLFPKLIFDSRSGSLNLHLGKLFWIHKHLILRPARVCSSKWKGHFSLISPSLYPTLSE
ncbi:putative initiation factor eIF-4 gamma, MA3 [Lupinus albus]|uniref:Putative initiation factor eIF-4 gamma, MA3 n=1 Tax=Lupinus albus TaxID=3870 RepID=A0A6A4PSA5_LUPAL|nr:putative initiation factor eIF-4 gamma, MA3 [Lupinus albus]